MTNIEIAKKILGCENVFQLPQNGARNLGMFVTVPGSNHKFSHLYPQVVLKLYKGDGYTKGFLEQFLPFHRDLFSKVEALTKNKLIQQSVEAGIFKDGETTRGYVVFQFVPGLMLRTALDEGNLTLKQCKTILTDIFENIWIPVWSAGLRIADCHTGNWIYGDDGRCYLNDTEQCRKDVFEINRNPDDWTIRNMHERCALKKVCGIFVNVLKAGGMKVNAKTVKSIILNTTLMEDLSALGRGGNDLEDKALESVRRVIDSFNLD